MYLNVYTVGGENRICIREYFNFIIFIDWSDSHVIQG